MLLGRLSSGVRPSSLLLSAHAARLASDSGAPVFSLEFERFNPNHMSPSSVVHAWTWLDLFGLSAAEAAEALTDMALSLLIQVS
mmetsp:Transcript_16816/g.48953  ORF Transcript_16816/g.48953 Transcript_16816/m.48953 type:complete len:84 (+) Transcript_16816:182-433(+)